MSYGIVIPAYYGRPFIKRCLDSIFNQQDINDSLYVVVIDDGTPEPESVTDLVSDYPVHYYRLKTNQGVFQTRLWGLAKLPQDVKYCAFLDQDDTWRPRFLATLTSLLDESSDLGFAACNACVTEEHNGGKEHALYDTRHPSLLLEDLKIANQLISPSQVLIRRQALDSLSYGDTHLPYQGADDWLLWLSILSKGYLAAYTDSILVNYYDHKQGAHHDTIAMSRSEEYIVAHYFPLLHFSHWDQRLYQGRVGWDHIAEGIRSKNLNRLFQGLRILLTDPVALNQARLFRSRHKHRGIV